MQPVRGALVGRVPVWWSDLMVLAVNPRAFSRNTEAPIRLFANSQCPPLLAWEARMVGDFLLLHSGILPGVGGGSSLTWLVLMGSCFTAV